MPTVVEELVEGFAFCPDPLCPSYEQEGAAVRVRTFSWSYLELGGDLPGIERQTIEESFPLEDGETPPNCPHCGKRMEATVQERPVYARISGQDPLRLLSLEQGGQVRGLQAQNAEQALELEKMRTMLAEMRAEMMEMMLSVRQPVAGIATTTGPEGGDVAGPAPRRRKAPET
jgi:hypothetical protein